nr:RHS repeat-associated core domain-containing protein [Treponema pedis]
MPAVSKELDEETGLYYYGARYLDPKYSSWLSGDSVLGEYISQAPVNDEAKKHNENLPGMGGIYNTVNLHVYHYAGNNPVKYIDPDGRDIILLNRESGAFGFGHNAVLIGNDTDGWMYYSKDGYFSTNEPEKFDTLAIFMEKNSSTSNYGYNRGYRISTKPCEDEKLKEYADKRFPLPYSIFAGNMEMEFDMTDAGIMEGSKAVITIYPDNIKENCADLTGKILDHGKKGKFFLINLDLHIQMLNLRGDKQT